MKKAALIAVAAAALAACGPSGSKTARTAPAAAPAAPAAPLAAGPLPALPAWAGGYLGKLLSDMPQARDCKGNTDRVRQRYAGPPAGAKIVGWGWDLAAGRRIEHVLLADESLKIVGAGEGGLLRADVPRHAPQVTDPNTGWQGLTTETAGEILAYGLVDGGRAVCPLGRVAL
jgi:hypothetical protein